MRSYGYEDEDDSRSTARVIGTVLGVGALVAVGWFVGRPLVTDEGGGQQLPVAGSTEPTTIVVASDATTSMATSSTSEATVTVTVDTTDNTAPERPTTTVRPTTTARPTTTTARQRATPEPSTNTTRRETTTTERRSSTTSAPQRRTTAPREATYPTLPDGTPEPVLAIFDIETITLSGTVPSKAAADRLGQLALANSKTPASLLMNLAIDPNVPKSVGVRVIELNSVRFPTNSAEILPAHAAEFDRVARVMQALPNVTVLVIGHADQRGSPEGNYAISDARARATVNYLISRGVSADRLSSRAVGADDLLTLNSDETALALNRRTEFVFYGLVADT